MSAGSGFGGLGALLGRRSMLAGLGQGQIARSEFEEQMRGARLGETSALAQALQRQQNVDRDYGEGVRRFDLGQALRERQFTEGVRRFDTGQNLRERQFREGIRQSDRNYTEGVRRIDRQYDESLRRYEEGVKYKKDVFTRQGEWHEEQQKLKEQEVENLAKYRADTLKNRLAAAGLRAKSSGQRMTKEQKAATDSLLIGGVNDLGQQSKAAVESLYEVAKTSSRKEPSEDRDRLKRQVAFLSSKSGDEKVLAFGQAIAGELEDAAHYVKKMNEISTDEGRWFAGALSSPFETAGLAGSIVSSRLAQGDVTGALTTGAYEARNEQLAERYAENRQNFVDSMNKLFALADQSPSSTSFRKDAQTLKAKIKFFDEKYGQHPRVRGMIEQQNIETELDNIIIQPGRKAE